MNRYIDIKLVTIPEDRFRREFDEEKNQELMASIQEIGLLQAPVLELVAGEYILRAGERRFRAISDIYEMNGEFKYDGALVVQGMLPYTLWTELTEIQRLAIEVEENTHRVPFTWQESVKATAKLARLRMMQAEDRGEAPPTVGDITKELQRPRTGNAYDTTRSELLLSKHLHNPIIANAKTTREALGLLKKEEQAKRHKQLAEITGTTYSKENQLCLLGDSKTWIESCVEGWFDVICTDPPYGIGADSFGEANDSTACAHEYEDSPDVLWEILDWFPKESFRVSTANAHMYIFCDIEWFPSWRESLRAVGWKVFRTPLIWHRPTGFRLPWITQGPQRKYETIVYAVKGTRPVNMVAPDCFTLQSAGQGLGYSAAKPWEVFYELLRRSALPGDKVLDPFCGSGPIFRAAMELNCYATGIEKTQKGYGIALAQLNKALEDCDA